MKINWKVRLKNPIFISQLILAVFVPILSYMGLTFQDLTSWSKLANIILQAVSNPYVLSLVVVSVYNAIVDPTTSGLGDSEQALKYRVPKSDEK